MWFAGTSSVVRRVPKASEPEDPSQDHESPFFWHRRRKEQEMQTRGMNLTQQLESVRVRLDDLLAHCNRHPDTIVPDEVYQMLWDADDAVFAFAVALGQSANILD